MRCMCEVQGGAYVRRYGISILDQCCLPERRGDRLKPGIDKQKGRVYEGVATGLDSRAGSVGAVRL